MSLPSVMRLVCETHSCSGGAFVWLSNTMHITDQSETACYHRVTVLSWCSYGGRPNRFRYQLNKSWKMGSSLTLVWLPNVWHLNIAKQSSGHCPKHYVRNGDDRERWPVDITDGDSRSYFLLKKFRSSSQDPLFWFSLFRFAVYWS